MGFLRKDFPEKNVDFRGKSEEFEAMEVLDQKKKTLSRVFDRECKRGCVMDLRYRGMEKEKERRRQERGLIARDEE